MKRVLVLKGGESREREVSLKTGAAVVQGLKEAGYDLLQLDIRNNQAVNLIRTLEKEKPDIVFIALHGRYGEDGGVQGILELYGVPYTGSGVTASAVAMDKILTKRLLLSDRLPTPGFIVLSRNDPVPKPLKMEFPVVVKPSREGSSLGTAIVKDENELEDSIKYALEFDREVLLEEYQEGKEITVGVIGNGSKLRALPAVEIIPSDEFFNFHTKYTKGATEYRVPAELGHELEQTVEDYALRVFKLLGLSDMARVDMIVSGQGDISILEVNTIPGMTETSLLPKSALAAGISFPELLKQIVEGALERYGG